jgi:transcription-repair coupling factor (superfamily II helicase)
MEELGAGFVLATHDLEIRGAGELLGEEQSGQMTEIGLAMYLDMLDQAVKALKEGREPALDKPLAAATEVELRLPAFLPDAYVADVHVRLGLYKRTAAAESNEALDELAAELYDRFGPLPAVAQSLLRIAKLKLSARAIGVRRLDLGPQGGTVLFEERNTIDPLTVVQMIQRAPREYRLEGSLKLRVSRPLPTEESRFEFAADLMKRLGEKPRAEPRGEKARAQTSDAAPRTGATPGGSRTGAGGGTARTPTGTAPSNSRTGGGPGTPPRRK